jgi:hypothetical protein
MYSLEKNYKNIYLSVFYDFSKFNGFRKNYGVTFLMVPLKKKLFYPL